MKPIFEALSQILGTPVYLVGGAVRDLLLRREPKDLDFVVEGLEVAEIARRLEAAGLPVNPAGMAYGVIGTTVHGTPVEVVSARRDLATDGRKAQVGRGTLLDDLARRDFTVNAMAMDGHGNLVDPFGGLQDLRAGVLRAVGDPGVRFREDYLRVVRLVRFGAQLGFQVDPATWQAALEAGPRVLGHVSLPRLGEELVKGLGSSRGAEFLHALREVGVLYRAFPELVGPEGPAHLLCQNPLHHPEGDVLTHLGEVASRAAGLAQEKGVDRQLAVWAGFLHDIGKPATAQPQGDYFSFHRHEAVGAELVAGIAARFGLSRAWREALATATRLHMRPLAPATPKAVRRFQAEAGGYLPLLEVVASADGEGRREDLALWFRQEAPVEPLVRGRDLLALGVAPGPRMGELLRLALDLQLEEGLTSKEEVLEAMRARGFLPR